MLAVGATTAWAGRAVVTTAVARAVAATAAEAIRVWLRNLDPQS